LRYTAEAAVAIIMAVEGQAWIDYVIAISTALAAIGTLAAVLLALYLNVWREQRSRPVLSFEEYEDTGFGIGFNPGEPTEESVFGVPLIVRNARGKKTAHNVQVLLTFSVKNEADWIDYVVDQPLVWKFADLPAAGSGVATVDIPPGVGRKVFVAFIGEPNQLYRTLWPREGRTGGFANEEGCEIEYDEFGNAIAVSPPIAGVLATYPFTQDAAFWFWRDAEYRFRFTLTSHDSDAATYEAIITFEYRENQGRTAEISGKGFISPHWPDPGWVSRRIS
jgi:hypothetical protein